VDVQTIFCYKLAFISVKHVFVKLIKPEA